MNRLKLLYTQASFISVGIFLGVGITQFIYHLLGDAYALEWHFTLSVILAGILCALPTLLLVGDNIKNIKLKIAIHFVLQFVIVTLLGFLFKWYSNLLGYLVVMAIFVCVYVFVWMTMLWVYKKDDKQINSALDSIRDEE